ncbi:DUF6266 family protein [Plebeiibacterium marinum]|uniref:DUF6266 family protein n=1 Tax=Plebeiibacterium marinum TaxID=2992111 RepID=A0AAE3MJ92_9BACT|nr:DUF6266 family protein [Plebeiobacterium marinum]MCW3808082.1 DUF6266 family protein [Plebeiobacterium marinum]
MGIANKGINGPVSGKVGSNVFYTVKGKNYIRTVPDIGSVKPTPKRLRQRQRLSLVTAFLKPFKDLVKITFAHITTGRSAYHTAQSLNMKNCIVGDVYPDQEIDYSKTILSTGNLQLPQKCSVKRVDSGLLFEWDGFDIGTNDTLMVTFLDSSKVWSEYRFTAATKYDKQYFWDACLDDDPVYVWMAFRSHNQQDMSDSVYLGQV